MVKDNVIVFSIACALMVIGLLFLPCQGDTISAFLIPVSFIMLIVIFYISKHKYKKDYVQYYNPFSFPLTCINAYFMIFSVSVLCQQSYMILRGITLKQIDSIRKTEIELGMKQKNLKEEYKHECGCGSSIRNLCKFLCKSTPESLINVETDI